MKRRAILAFVQNKPGTLNKISMMIRRKMYNVDTLTVCKAKAPGVSRMTITLREDDEAKMKKLADKIIKYRIFSDADGKMNWADATFWAGNLILGGYSDWRLPTIEELASLLEGRRTDGWHVDPLFDKKQKSCWSSDKGPLVSGFGNAPQVWHVLFGEGSLGLTVLYFKHYVGMNTEYRYVRAVRSIE